MPIYTANLTVADRAGKTISLISFTDILSFSIAVNDTCVYRNIHTHIYPNWENFKAWDSLTFCLWLFSGKSQRYICIL